MSNVIVVFCSLAQDAVALSLTNAVNEAGTAAGPTLAYRPCFHWLITTSFTPMVLVVRLQTFTESLMIMFTLRQVALLRRVATNFTLSPSPHHGQPRCALCCRMRISLHL